MLKLYSLALSPWTRKVRLALYEKGIPFDKVSLQMGPDGSMEKPAELLAANPRGQVPTLVDGDVTLYESTVILEYLEDAYPDPPLYPKKVKARARCRLLVNTGDRDLADPVGTLINQIYFIKDASQRDAAAIAEAKEALRKVYDRLEAELGQGPWFCGEQFTAADIALVIPISVANFFQAGPGDDHKRLKDWLERLMARESFQKDLPEVMAAAS